LQIPPGVILYFGLQFLLPESPRWLIRHHKYEEARTSFSKIRGDNRVRKDKISTLPQVDLLLQAIHIEFDEMKEQILYEKV
jgi:hypothetical protein